MDIVKGLVHPKMKILLLITHPHVSRRSEKLFFLHRKSRQGYPFGFLGGEILSFSNLLETLDSGRGPWDLVPCGSICIKIVGYWTNSGSVDTWFLSLAFKILG